MRNHITHPQGRDPHNLNKYIWRFIALSTAKPRIIHIVATSEQEARRQSPAGCVMVFTARIRQGWTYEPGNHTTTGSRTRPPNRSYLRTGRGLPWHDDRQRIRGNHRLT
ncbi:host cell division inhibitor Icd-like protein [Escherichia coli]|nr:host cell division inhibitor Icd-like protein [Escherichia coli]